MRSPSRTVSIAALALAVATPVMAKKPSPCPGGRFLVAGGALVAGDSAAPHEPIVVGTTTVSVGEVCPPVTGKLTATRRGTTVKAAWRGCVGLAGPVHLKATFDATCTVLTGTVVARRGSPKRRPFTARRSVCGDGVVDPGAGEQCDGAGCGATSQCDARCQCLPLPPAPTTTTLTSFTTSTTLPPQSVARQWDEEALSAIRLDTPRPPVHARNLFHLSVAMWDAWVAYDQTQTAVGRLTTERHPASDPEADRAQAISFAAYRVLSARYAHAVGAATSLANFDAKMDALGYDKTLTSTAGDTPAAVGNRVAAAVLAYGATDGANEAADYADPTYTPVNAPLIVKLPGTTMNDPNRWQPLALDFTVTQNGIPLPANVQTFIGSQWGTVKPFAFDLASNLPPPQPHLGGVGDDLCKQGFVDDIRKSSALTPDDGVYLDISPAVKGNNPLGTNDGTGYAVNPVTGAPYASNIVKRGDWARALAEFWADGPNSETPPGHWNVIANDVSDHLEGPKRLGGTGPLLNDLEWDVKLYLAVNGAVHDAAVGCWGTKRLYDAVRPISAIRYLAGLGQSSDASQPFYSASGLPLIPGLIELITPATTAPGQRHAALAAFVGELALYAWPGQPADPATEYRGVQWIRALTWVPYQKATFVTPAFPGYTSGHSTFSRAGAEVLAAFTGSAFFPGGLGEFVAPQNAFLKFELGPSETVVLQWATYYDASDEAGLSRLYGGIHPFFDDFGGRLMGATIGRGAFALAQQYYAGTVTVTSTPTTTSSTTTTTTAPPTTTTSTSTIATTG